MPSELSKNYDPAAVHAEVAAVWDAERCFHAEVTDAGEPYSIVIPPPNVTAALHLGHALNNTIQDILIRRARMQGKNAVWLPGTDHAGIATQSVVEKRVLKEEGRKRTDFPREEFVEKIQAWKDEYEKVILGQLKSMGCSCDFERTAFTMDEPRAKAVREAFFLLFKAGLIYRGKRLVNWDPVTQTALADDEVENEEVDGFFYYLKYPLCDKHGAPIEARASGVGFPTVTHVTVATTRPETMLGDTAIAVNPTDPRAAALHGKFVKLPIVGRIIPIIEDDYVVKPVQYGGDPADTKAQMATGFLKVTPAHDQNDYDIGTRHKLPVINTMAPDGSISDKHGWSDGIGDADFLLRKSRETAREEVVEWFRRHGLLEDVKPYRHSVGHSYRSHVPIEPYLSDQWYCRVTDDRLRGAALRALNTPATSRDREGAPSAPAALPRVTYLLTFTTYGTWLHGDDKGSVHPDQNVLGTPVIHGDVDKERSDYDRLKHAPFTLDESARSAVQAAIIEVCEHRDWSLHALHVRTSHVHVVVTADREPERVMIDFKAYATRRLKAEKLIFDDAHVWTRHGSTRYLNFSKSLDAAVEYVVDSQGSPLTPGPVDSRGPALPDGRGSLPKVTFYPQRYAKTYQTWHENIRDWCISRQLWWGHRIPVWSREGLFGHVDGSKDECWQTDKAANLTYICLRTNDAGLISDIEKDGFVQDPDVLDTWFSSALWPMSTLGWPAELSQRAATVSERPAPAAAATHVSHPENAASSYGPSGAMTPEAGGRSLTVAARSESVSPELTKWNPTTVLTTAREIITLWVSRMVMFNEFFLGQIPFKDVFIHAMIQDGDGRKMSKSLGNGVDPLDIIHSHGADAMRFTLASMCTQTQDVRMPVVKDESTGRNTSPKFDIGRNFANKMWNAGRFVLAQIESVGQGSSPLSLTEEKTVGMNPALLSFADRWIISRLNRTIAEIDDAISEYRFDVYAKSCYDFFWRDFCDWYVESAKPQMKDESRRASTAAVLAAVLDASLRLLHPATPFITEKLWWNLNEIAPQRSLPGVLDLPPSKRLIKAAWPIAGAIDAPAEAAYGVLQDVVAALRNLRSTYKIEPKKSLAVAIRAPAAAAAALLQLQPALELLATCTLTAAGPDVAEPANATRAQAGACEVFVADLVDADAEKLRAAKRRDELAKVIGAMKGRLTNQGYLAKAPPNLVKQTQDQLAEAEAELASLR